MKRYECRFNATGNRVFTHPWREDGPLIISVMEWIRASWSSIKLSLSLFLCIKRNAGISSLLGVAGNVQLGGSALRLAPTMHRPPVARVGMWHIRKEKIDTHLSASLCAAETLYVQRSQPFSLSCGCSGSHFARSGYPPGDKPAGFSQTSPELLLRACMGVGRAIVGDGDRIHPENARKSG